MKSYVENFKVYLIDEKKSSSNTLESYIRDVNQFVSYCSSLNIEKLSDVDNNVLRVYLENIKNNAHETIRARFDIYI